MVRTDDTLLVNLFGGPGTGKSTTCAGIFHELKVAGVNCEMALEYAKDRVWEGSEVILGNQIYVFGKQYHRIWRLLGKVDVVITDSPLLNSILYYEGDNDHFKKAVAVEHGRLTNLNIILERQKPYNPSGRVQTEQKAKDLDNKIVDILDLLEEHHFTFAANQEAPKEIAEMVLRNYEDINTPFGVFETSK